MEVGIIGLGALGGKMVSRLVGDWRVVVYDKDPQAVQRMVEMGAMPSPNLVDVVSALKPPRVIWLVLPPGQPTEQVLRELRDLLAADDAVVDGGNSHYKDSIRRANEVAEHGIHFLDVGMSGGLGETDRGSALLIGGSEAIVDRLRPLFATIAADPDKGWGRVGPSGAGHYAKMIHNGVEYGMIRAYAQGLSALDKKSEFEFDLTAVTDIWRHGAMVRSALLDLIQAAMTENADLGQLAPYVADLGSDRWTVEEALDQIAQRGYDREQFA